MDSDYYYREQREIWAYIQSMMIIMRHTNIEDNIEDEK